ncbi:MAG: PaaI family thioesterase, partial [Rubrivivax sp.]|nr:PaaI family thioesterase [Rubrivivax sp.]
MSRDAGKLQFPLRIPFVEELGLELWAFADGQAELRVDLADAHLNSWAVAHGGVLMTMLDVAMAHAARSANGQAPDHGPGVATVEMKTTFMRPGEGRLRAAGTLLHKTTTMAFTEGSVFNEAGQLCAHATGTFKYLRALPPPCATPNRCNVWFTAPRAKPRTSHDQ